MIYILAALALLLSIFASLLCLLILTFLVYEERKHLPQIVHDVKKTIKKNTTPVGLISRPTAEHLNHQRNAKDLEGEEEMSRNLAGIFKKDKMIK